MFASDDSERRLRFKPMTSHQRAFLHYLAEDFGLDSESMDPEPHRHVAVFKTPRFVSAPNKTLAECLRLRPQPVSAAEPTKINANTAATNANAEPYNALLLLTLRFGLTQADLTTALGSILQSSAGITFDISFLPNGDEVVLKARNTNNTYTPLADQDLASAIRNMKPKLKRAIAEKGVAGDVVLCRVSPDSPVDQPRIVRREGDGTDNASGEGGGGWSQVVAGSGVKKMIAPLGKGAVGNKSSFTVLGSRVREKERKAKEEMARRESVVDDWEEEVRKEEMEEKGKVGEKVSEKEDGGREMEGVGIEVNDADRSSGAGKSGSAG